LWNTQRHSIDNEPGREPNIAARWVAAGATLEHGGQTYYFIDERTRQDFARQKGIAIK